jgi:hypothetical protein
MGYLVGFIAAAALVGRLAEHRHDRSLIASLAQRVAEQTKRSEQWQFEHFRELRTLCRPAQQAVFDTLIPKLLLRRGGRSSNRGSSKVDN